MEKDFDIKIGNLLQWESSVMLKHCAEELKKRILAWK